MAHQYLNLAEIGEKLKAGMLTVQALKDYQNYVRCSEYPDLGKFELERVGIEKAWPAFSEDYALNRAPSYVWQGLRGASPAVLSETVNMSAWYAEGKAYRQKSEERLQYVMARMNHHIHPIVDATTGERRPLPSCQPKGKPKECKSGFPLNNEIKII